MKTCTSFVLLCGIIAIVSCDPMPELPSKNYKGLVPEVVSKLNTLRDQIQVFSDQTPIVANEVRSCYNHMSDELQMIRTDTARGIEKCADSIYIEAFYTYQAIQDYVSNIQENMRFIRETFSAHCANASYLEYVQCFADSMEESQNARIAVEKNFVEIYNVFAPKLRSITGSTRSCILSVLKSAVDDIFDISCQSY